MFRWLLHRRNNQIAHTDKPGIIPGLFLGKTLRAGSALKTGREFGYYQANFCEILCGNCVKNCAGINNYFQDIGNTFTAQN
jgi:hypothetical protein